MNIHFPRLGDGRFRELWLSLTAILFSFVGCGSPGSPAYQAYVQFTNASINSDCDVMYALAEAGAVPYVDNLCKPRTIMLLGKEIYLGSPANIVADIKPVTTPLHPLITLEREIESETKSADRNEVDLVVIEHSFQRTGNLLKPTWLMKHTVTVRKSDQGWKITRFTEEVLRDFGGEEAAKQAEQSEAAHE